MLRCLRVQYQARYRMLGCKTGPERDWTTVLCRWRDEQMDCGYAITSVNGEGVLKTKILYL